jgi:uncharacterized membrane protein (UPF0127 family)
MDETEAKRPSIVVIATMVMIAIVFVVLKVKQVAANHIPVGASLTVAGRVFDIEVANTPKKQERGLSGRKSLDEGKGMYFPMPASQYWVFWMQDMKIPIDIVWIRDNKVVDVTKDAPPPVGDEQPATFSPREPADAVLEIPAGASEGIKLGDVVELKTE